VQDDLRNGGEFVVRTPEARAGSPFQYCMGFETYLVRDRFDLGKVHLCSQFPRHIDEDRVTVMEVPILMVALVVTAVSSTISL
jgi:hypothetical protein